MSISTSGHVTWMAFSEDGARFALCDNKGAAVYDSPQHRLVFTHPTAHGDCALSPDGQYLACRIRSSPTYLTYLDHVEVWEVGRNKCVYNNEFPPATRRGKSFCLKFSPDSARLAVVREDGLVSAINIATGQKVDIERFPLAASSEQVQVFSRIRTWMRP